MKIGSWHAKMNRNYRIDKICPVKYIWENVHGSDGKESESDCGSAAVT